jgi:hypothetical protein
MMRGLWRWRADAVHDGDNDGGGDDGDCAELNRIAGIISKRRQRRWRSRWQRHTAQPTSLGCSWLGLLRPPPEGGESMPLVIALATGIVSASNMIQEPSGPRGRPARVPSSDGSPESSDCSAPAGENPTPPPAAFAGARGGSKAAELALFGGGAAGCGGVAPRASRVGQSSSNPTAAVV